MRAPMLCAFTLEVCGRFFPTSHHLSPSCFSWPMFYQYLHSIKGPYLSPIGSLAHLYPPPALSYLSAVRPTDRIVPHLLRGSLPLFEPLTPTSPMDFSSGSVLFAVRHCYGPHSATPAPQVPATIWACSLPPKRWILWALEPPLVIASLTPT